MRQGSQSAQACGCDPGADWVCERHAAKNAEALYATTENSPPAVPYVPKGGNWMSQSQSAALPQSTGALAPNRATTETPTEWDKIWSATTMPEVNAAPNRATSLPLGSRERKRYPIASGVLDYFPDALVAIAFVSYVGNDQHNPGEPVHWAREKSTDQADTLMRHFLERGAIDTDGQRHTAKLAWRALALLQLELEQANEVV